MPNKRTFTIKPIAELLVKYNSKGFIDPFPFVYKKDVLVFLSDFGDNSVNGVLFDPPYSPRQLKECYDSVGMALHDTKSSVWASWKDEIARVIRPGGFCLSFGWSSNGLGKNRGFEIVEILLVAHGGNHNDTICVVEKKTRMNVSFWVKPKGKKRKRVSFLPKREVETVEGVGARWRVYKRKKI